jgi:FecR protein
MAEPRKLDALLALARDAEPPVLGTLDARRMARHAQRAALERGQRRTRVRYVLLCAAALLALGGGFAWQRAPTGTKIAVGESDRPLRIALKTGDSLLLAPGSELAVLEQRSEHRRVRLSRGRVLFDVAKLGAGQGFEVQAETTRVRVLGTIFSVELDEGRTLVRVYEGRVAVDGRVLAAPGVWASRGAPPRDGDALFEREAHRLASARSTPARVEASPQDSADAVSASRVASTAAAHAISASAPPPQVEAASERPAAPARALAARSGEASVSGTPEPQAPEQQVAAVLAGDPAPPASAASAPDAGAKVELDRGRALLAAGDARAARALALAHAAHDDEALLLVADAERALGRHGEARARYRELAERSSEPLRGRAAFAAAQLAFDALHEPADALALLTAFGLIADEALLRERASALEVDVLLALGRRAAALDAARRYLAREAETETSRRMRELLAR